MRATQITAVYCQKDQGVIMMHLYLTGAIIPFGNPLVVLIKH